jgi:hypothetical protein
MSRAIDLPCCDKEYKKYHQAFAAAANLHSASARVEFVDTLERAYFIQMHKIKKAHAGRG